MQTSVIHSPPTDPSSIESKDPKDEIPADLKDSLAVLSEWGMFVGGGMVGDQSDIGLLTDDLEQQYKDFFTAVSGDIASGEIATKLSNEQWKNDNGNFLLHGDDMGCPLMYTLEHGNPLFRMPLMHDNGGFDPYHAHILPALMIKRLLSDVSSFRNNKVKTYVLCHGNGIRPSENWWMKPFDSSVDLIRHSEYVADLILSCSAFKSIKGDKK